MTAKPKWLRVFVGAQDKGSITNVEPEADSDLSCNIESNANKNIAPKLNTGTKSNNLQGNSAAVYYFDSIGSAPKTEVMQYWAKNTAAPATVFFYPLKEDSSKHDHDLTPAYGIRWFSPSEEIQFCGHGTLAAAYVLQQMHSDSLSNHFDKSTHKPSHKNCHANINWHSTSVGLVQTQVIDDTPQVCIEMKFPSRMPDLVEEPPKALINSLSIQPSKIYRNQQAYFACYDNDQAVRDVSINVAALHGLTPHALIVTAPANGCFKRTPYDFVSRYFWPLIDGGEDAVTGSAHTGLAPLWSALLKKAHLCAYQCSEQGGEVYCRLDGLDVYIGGYVVTDEREV